MSETKKFRSGFVAIMGRPNVGKSSLMNRFVGEKVAIISNHPQTTRNKLLGVATGEDWQIVFVDTPGLHKPRTKLGEFMVKSANDAREGVDAVLCVVDGQHIGAGDMAIIQDIARMACPKFLAVNKTDIVPEEKLFPQLAQLHDCGFDQVVSTSARKSACPIVKCLLGEVFLFPGASASMVPPLNSTRHLKERSLFSPTIPSPGSLFFFSSGALSGGRKPVSCIFSSKIRCR